MLWAKQADKTAVSGGKKGVRYVLKIRENRCRMHNDSYTRSAYKTLSLIEQYFYSRPDKHGIPLVKLADRNFIESPPFALANH
jgi:hypothetical protein